MSIEWIASRPGRLEKQRLEPKCSKTQTAGLAVTGPRGSNRARLASMGRPNWGPWPPKKLRDG